MTPALAVREFSGKHTYLNSHTFITFWKTISLLSQPPELSSVYSFALLC